MSPAVGSCPGYWLEADLTKAVGDALTAGRSDRVKQVDADRLGGSATVTVTPTGWGRNRLVVSSVDRTGAPGPIFTFPAVQALPAIEPSCGLADGGS